MHLHAVVVGEAVSDEGKLRLYQTFDIARNVLQGFGSLLQLLKGCSGFITPPEQQTKHLRRAGREGSLCSGEQPGLVDVTIIMSATHVFQETTFVWYGSTFMQQ